VHALHSIVVGLLIVWAFEVVAIAAVALLGATRSRVRSDSGRAQVTMRNDLSSYDPAHSAIADLVGSSRRDV
jgi:hypothetical protein